MYCGRHDRQECFRRFQYDLNINTLTNEKQSPLFSVLRIHPRKLQRFSISHSERLPRQPVCHFNGVEYALALSEDLVDFLELKVAGLWEEEVDDCNVLVRHGPRW